MFRWLLLNRLKKLRCLRHLLLLRPALIVLDLLGLMIDLVPLLVMHPVVVHLLVYAIFLTGNAANHCLFAGVETLTLTAPPFKPQPRTTWCSPSWQ